MLVVVEVDQDLVGVDQDLVGVNLSDLGKYQEFKELLIFTNWNNQFFH